MTLPELLAYAAFWASLMAGLFWLLPTTKEQRRFGWFWTGVVFAAVVGVGVLDLWVLEALIRRV